MLVFLTFLTPWYAHGQGHRMSTSIFNTKNLQKSKVTFYYDLVFLNKEECMEEPTNVQRFD